MAMRLWVHIPTRASWCKDELFTLTHSLRFSAHVRKKLAPSSVALVNFTLFVSQETETNLSFFSNLSSSDFGVTFVVS